MLYEIWPSSQVGYIVGRVRTTRENVLIQIVQINCIFVETLLATLVVNGVLNLMWTNFSDFVLNLPAIFRTVDYIHAHFVLLILIYNVLFLFADGGRWYGRYVDVLNLYFFQDRFSSCPYTYPINDASVKIYLKIPVMHLQLFPCFSFIFSDLISASVQ